MVGTFHGICVHSRRVRVLAGAIAPLIPPGSRIIDAGCGDGLLTKLISEQASGVQATGYDTYVRPEAHICVHVFDGTTLPVESESVDGVLLVDVLHHTLDPFVLLREAARVARNFIVLKDHRTGRVGAALTLRMMDWAGNTPHGVASPNVYWSEAQWREAWKALGLRAEHYQTRLGLYAFPGNLVFERGLHFLAKLTKHGG